MASTRKVNNPIDYAIEQDVNERTNQHMTMKSYGVPDSTYYPGFGLLQGRVAPTRIAANYCDLESNLRGIGASNLVSPLPPLKPEIYNPSSLNIADYKPPLILPTPLKMQSNQRPNIQS